MLTKPLLTFMLMTNCLLAQDFAKLADQRHSGYSFDPAKPVTKETLIKISQVASKAPSSYNDQPWKFIFTDKVLTPEAYKKLLDTLVEPNQKWATNAPVLILVLADTISPYNKKFNRFAEYDTGAAAMSLVLGATEMGLMAHQMGGYDAEKTKQIFQLPTNLVPMAVIALGYESADQTPEPKKRKPLNESFFLGELNKGL